jgi:ATP-dependent Lon protease
MDDVLKHALVRMPEPIEWDEEAEEAAAAARAAAEKAGEGTVRAH